jgi:TolC family type I secretion outer membrane protein
MFPTSAGRGLIRSLAAALVCSCQLAGCAPSLARRSVDLPPALTAPSGAPEASRPPPAGTPSRTPPPPASSPLQQVGLTSPSDAPAPLSLPDAIAVALQDNPRLRAALTAIERARGQEEVAFAPFLPQVDLLNRFVATGKSIVPGAPGPTGAVNVDGPGPYAVYQSELQIQWTLYDFGRTAGRYGQAEQREKIARLQALRAKQTVAYDVAAAYLQALEAAAFRRIAAEAVRRAEAVLEDVRARREGGVALRDDVLRGQVQLSEARDSQVRAEDAEVAARARLNNALGRDASLPVTLVEGLYAGALTASLADCLQLAANQRPEVGVAQDRVAVAQFGRVAARGEFLPSLGLKASLGRIEGNRDVVGGWQEGVGIQVNVPLYRGGANRGNLRSADADISQALADAQGLLNDVSQEVTVAYRGVVSAQERVGLSRPAVEQSAEALRIVRDRYRNGTATPTDVIEAEAAATRSEQRYAAARIEYVSALVRLAYALGFEPGELCLPLTGPPDVPAPQGDTGRG